MKHVNTCMTALAVLLVAALCTPVAAQVDERTVFVSIEGGGGVGILRPRPGGECSVLVPRHVVADTMGGRIQLWGPQLQAEAELETERFSTDLSVLRITSPLAGAACPRWPGTGGVNLALRRAAAGRVPAALAGWQSQAGPSVWIPVTIEDLDVTQFLVRLGSGGRLQKGMSGSLIYADGRPVGIVVDVGEDAAGDFGTALRLDYVERHLEPLFRPMIRPSNAQIGLSVLVPGLGQAATRRRSSALLALGVAVAGSAVAYAYPDDRTVTLTGQTPSGETYEFSRTERRYPARQYWWAPWLAVGALSAVESFRYADRHYMPPNRGEAASSSSETSTRLRLRLDVATSADALQVQLAEIRF